MYEQLLNDNRGLLAWGAGKYLGAVQRDNAISYEDLLQTAFIGLVEAQRTYDASKGDTWTHWAMQHIETAIKRAIGWRGGWIKAHTGAASLDAPLGDETDETGLDLLADDGPPIDADAILADDQRVVRECVEALEDERQRETVKRWKLGDATQAQVAEALGVSSQMVSIIWKKAQKALARDQRLRALMWLEDHTPYYAHVGVQRFNSTNTSAVEKAVLWRIDRDGGGKAPPPPSLLEAAGSGKREINTM